MKEYKYSDSVIKKKSQKYILDIVKKYSYSSSLYVRCVLIDMILMRKWETTQI